MNEWRVVENLYSLQQGRNRYGQRQPLNSTWLGEQNAALVALFRTDAKAVQQSVRSLSRTRKSLRKSRLGTSLFETIRRLLAVGFRSPSLTLSANALHVGQIVTWAAAKLPH
jgi:hypothetical protein